MSDFCGGKTGGTHEGIVFLGLSGNLTLDIDYYDVEGIEDSDQDRRLLQVRVSAKA